MIRKSLLLKIYSAANMQRWNDKIRPVDLRELDKQAHKAIIAYCIIKELSLDKETILSIVKGLIFEFFHRIVVTDIKPQILNSIKQNDSQYKKLNKWVANELDRFLSPVSDNFYGRFLEYFSTDKFSNAKKILEYANYYATFWEYLIIEQSMPEELEHEKKIHAELEGKLASNPQIDNIIRLKKSMKQFIDLNGLLRFQLRWGHAYRGLRTSVLGHMLVVALISYFLTFGGSDTNDNRYQRAINNFFTGLFHDLPEVLTKDVITPVKQSTEDFSLILKKYEKEQMDKKVFPLLSSDMQEEIRLFTEDEFDRKDAGTFFSGNLPIRDGNLVCAADHLSAFVEAYLAIKTGSPDPTFNNAMEELKKIYTIENKDKKADLRVIKGVHIDQIYADFEI